jgi:alkanesulfonate monooxygenase SsuD/methylene tetrahydromethanopterin reductase-like flavin-dependent oxidoreductase (luciferase family)
MRIGISLTSAHPGTDPHTAVRNMIARARAARDAALDSLFIGDHHSTGPGAYYQNVPMLGRLLAEWGDRPAGCLFLLPLWNPVLVAEQIGTLASIAEGRFIMQCALGAGRSQFEGMGVNQKQRPSLFEEGLDIVRRLLAGETVSSEGRYRIREARIAPIPPEPVEVWIGGSAEPSVDRAARLGDAYLGGPELNMEHAKRWIDFYRERCVAHDRPPSAIGLRRDVYVGESAEEARTVAGPIVERGYRGIDPSALVYGSVEEVAEQLRAYGDMGCTDILIRHITNEQRQVLASIERAGRVREMVQS